MSRIETEIWEPHPEKKGMVRYVGQRKTADVFRDIETFLKEENLYPEDYLNLSFDFENRYKEFPKMMDIQCYAQWGSNEGIYLEASLTVRNEQNNKLEHVPFLTGKTLEETEEAYDRMQYIAGQIYKAFMGESTINPRYIMKNRCIKPEEITYEMLIKKLERESRNILQKRLLHNEEPLSKISGELGLILQILDVLQEPSVFESLSMDKRKELYETEDILLYLYHLAEHIRITNRYEIDDLVVSATTLLKKPEGKPNFSLELPENAYYGFSCFSRMDYRDTLRGELIDEIVFGIYVRNDGCISEAAIGWEDLDGKPVLYVKAFDDGLQAAYSQKFLAVVRAIRQSDALTPEEVSKLLICEGFEDCSDDPLVEQREDKINRTEK